MVAVLAILEENDELAPGGGAPYTHLDRNTLVLHRTRLLATVDREWLRFYESLKGGSERSRILLQRYDKACRDVDNIERVMFGRRVTWPDASHMVKLRSDAEELIHG